MGNYYDFMLGLTSSENRQTMLDVLQDAGTWLEANESLSDTFIQVLSRINNDNVQCHFYTGIDVPTWCPIPYTKDVEEVKVCDDANAMSLINRWRVPLTTKTNELTHETGPISMPGMSYLICVDD